MTMQVGEQLGNYRLLHLLKEGGSADIYLGCHIHLERRVAIKVLRMRLTTEEIGRFRKEAQTIARLEHPHIVEVLDFDVQNGTPFLVMNYVPNGTLRQRHPRGTRLPLSTVVSYVQQTASALQYAHEQRVIHRDIKPENLLIGANQEIVLSDFGIALVLQSSLSLHTTEMAGTVAYMAPEQIEGRPRPNSDQYALAVLAYEWLSGELPFDGTFAEIASKKSTTSAPPLRDKLPDLSPTVEAVVMTALAKDPKDRFVNVQAFAMALEHSTQASGAKQVNASQALPAEQIPFTPTASLPSEPMGSPQVAVQSGAMITPAQLTPSIADAGQKETSPRGRAVPESPGKPPIAQPSRRRISRRAVVISALALAAVGGGMGIALSWISRSKSTQPTPTVPHRPNVVANSHPTDYAAFGFDLQHTHFNPLEQTLSPDTVSYLVSYWVASTGTTINSSPAVVNGVIYIGCDDFKLYAFDARNNGASLWTFPTNGRVYSSPAVNDNIVYFGSSDGKFYAVDAITGKSRWTFSTSNSYQINSSPIAADGIVYFGAFDTKLYALDASSGQILWATPTDAYIVSSPSISDGIVYIGSGGGSLYAMKASTGDIIWSTRIGDRVNSTPAIANGIVYVGSSDTQLYALNASTGKILWKAPAGEALSSSPAVAQGIVYIGSPDSRLYAFNAVTGKLVWSASTPNQLYCSPTVANGVVYIGCWDFKVYAFNAATGKLLWSSAYLGDHIFSSPAVVNGVLYVGSWDSKVYTFHLPT